MAEFDTSSLTKEQIAMAMKCKTADELIALAKKMGVVITKEQAEAYMTELQDYELLPAGYAGQIVQVKVPVLIMSAVL